MNGKVPQELLDRYVLDRTGAPDGRVRQGPAYGEDTGAISLECGTLVVSTDPISLAVERLGTLGVAVACNDIAASGAEPAWLTVAMFLPDDDPAVLDTLTHQLHEAAADRGVAIVSGHSEYAPDRPRPTLVLTAFGLTDRYVPTGGAEVGDAVIMTKTAATEGTAILAADFGDTLRVDPGVVEAGMRFYDHLDVQPEARTLWADATAMHDPTEGGLVNGLLELAAASGVAIEVEPTAIPVAEATTWLCEAAAVDPLRIFSSGVLVATVPADALEAATERLDEMGIEASVIGRVTDDASPSLTIGETGYTEPVRDDLYALWA